MENDHLHVSYEKAELSYPSNKNNTLSSGRHPVANRERDRDSVARDKERLLRFHREAKSFLTKAYSNDDDVLIEDRFDHVPTASDSADDFLVKRRIELDKIRLERFHAQAVSFLNRAYNDEPDTLVVEETLSPDRTAALQSERAMLQSFHEEAMSFLDAAATRAPDVDRSGGREKNGSSREPDETEHSSQRIQRDKARLEQNYQDVMSFLKRADEEGKDALIEEQELEPHDVERIQLRKYAKDAMSFLDKAFRNEASVMIGDEDEYMSQNSEQIVENETNIPHQNKVSQPEPRKRPPTPTAHYRAPSEKGSIPWRAEEDRQIAEDRAALQRYDEEFGDFLSKAYLDDSTVIVDDCDSENAPTEQSDVEDHIVPGAISVRSPSPPPEEFASEIYLNKQRPSPPRRKHPRPDASPIDNMAHLQDAKLIAPERALLRSPGISRHENSPSSPQTFESSLAPRQFEIGKRIDLTTEGHRVSPAPSLERAPPDSSFGDRSRRWRGGAANGVNDTRAHEEGAAISSLQAIENEGLASPKSELSRMGGGISREKRHLLQRSPENSSDRSSDRASSAASPLVYFALEEQDNQRHGWSEMPLEKSFYRQLPRGSTIKLRPRAAEDVSIRERTGNAHIVSNGINQILLNDLRRVEKERDALISALEEILNERSMLAQQLSEIKTTALGAKRGRVATRDVSTTEADIDLAAELRDTHAIMAKLTEEMELTLSVLDGRYRETLRRAEKAEQRYAKLQTENAHLEREMSGERKLATKSLSEQNRLLLLVRDLDQKVTNQKNAQLGREHDQNEIARLEGVISQLTKEGLERENHLKWQMSMLRSKAEEAEKAAARAEQDAKEAAEVARVAVERSQSERKARHAAEADKNSVVMESKAWEKFARQRMEISAIGSETVEDMESSSKVLGSDGSASKHTSKDNPKKKRDASRGSRGGSERTNNPSLLEEVRKKSLGRLFR